MLLSLKNRNSKSAKSVANLWGKSLSKRDWYSVQKCDDNNTEIRIYDIIGWPFVEADTFVGDLNRIESDNITVAINSPGGDVFDGTAIYNALKNHPANITTRIDGIAASMASIIALAGDNVQIADNAYYMIHNPWTFSIGGADDLRKDAELLDRIGKALGDIYVKKTGKSADEIKSAMTNESWYVGNEAESFGFADETLGESDSAVAVFDTGIFSHAPSDIKQNKRGTDDMPTERELERVLTRDAGLTRSAARQIMSGGYAKPGAGNELTSLKALNEIIRSKL